MKKILAAALAAAMTLSLLAACNSSSTTPGGASSSYGSSSRTDSNDVSIIAPVDDDENYDTGDASLDDPRNSDGIGESELLVVSFGTSFNDNRRLTIGAIESALENAFDFPIPVQANTIAMSTPHEIEYTLFFDSTTIRAQS